MRTAINLDPREGIGRRGGADVASLDDVSRRRASHDGDPLRVEVADGQSFHRAVRPGQLDPGGIEKFRRQRARPVESDLRPVGIGVAGEGGLRGAVARRGELGGEGNREHPAAVTRVRRRDVEDDRVGRSDRVNRTVVGVVNRGPQAARAAVLRVGDGEVRRHGRCAVNLRDGGAVELAEGAVGFPPHHVEKRRVGRQWLNGVAGGVGQVGVGGCRVF